MIKMKKILYLHAGAEMYGADKILLEIVGSLDKRKFTPIVILPEEGKLVNELSKIGVNANVLPYPIVRRKYFTLRGIVAYIWKYIQYSIKLTKIVRKQKIQIVHVNTTAVWEGVWLKVFTSAKILWHVHEIIIKPHVVYRVVAFLLQHFSDEIITVSNATKERLTESGFVDSQKVTVIHNGISGKTVLGHRDNDVAKGLGIQSDAIVIGMVGRVNSWKGQKDFLKAAIPNLRNNDKVEVLLVGSPYKGEEFRNDEIYDLIRSLEIDLQKRIKFIPFQNDVARVYGIIDIFVMPSTSPDPFPTVVLEAMANGIPVVGYEHGGVVEMVTKGINGQLVEPLNYKKLSETIQQLIDNPDKRIKMGAAAKIRQQDEFELENFSNKLMQVYDELVK